MNALNVALSTLSLFPSCVSLYHLLLATFLYSLWQQGRKANTVGGMWANIRENETCKLHCIYAKVLLLQL